ncbi:MAG: transglutaminase-like domain-containing protein, partial [Rhodothermales bacterium]|nr:transglutaminase-like domain-containing protein [Rhodothermales bacterium]
DVPALREEPFMTSPRDYRASLQLQLSSYYSSTFGLTPLNNTWEQLAESLEDLPRWRDYVDTKNVVEKRTEEVIAASSTDEEKLAAIHEHLRSTISWDGSHTFIPFQSPGDLLKTNRGTVAEINMMLVSMCRAAGLEAYPVLLSTRSHGRVVVAYPLLDQFDYLVAAVKISGTMLLVDATDPHRPYTMLPGRALNGSGWLVRENDPKWIDFQSEDAYQRAIQVTASIDDEGTVDGQFELVDTGYRAVRTRRVLEKDDDELVRTDILESTKAQLGTYTVAARDSILNPVRLSGEFTLPSYAQVAGDFIYVNPQLLERWEDNPLRPAERRFPVDFTYARKSHFRLVLSIPEGYEVVEVPSNVRFSPESGGGLFSRTVMSDGRQIVMDTRFNIIRTVFKPNQYRHIRAFFERVVKSQGAQLVLRRAAEDETEGQTAEIDS